MPPKQRITAEMILDAAFQITRESGFDAVNARSLAKVIGCSTQPIFSHYKNMIILKQDFHQYLGKYFDDFAIGRAMKAENFSREIGRSYVTFAKHEKNLFKVLFMSECFGLKGLQDMFSDEGNLEAAKGISKNTGLSLDNAKEFYMKNWIFLHGIASLLATNSIELTDDEIDVIHQEASAAFMMQAKSKLSKSWK